MDILLLVAGAVVALFLLTAFFGAPYVPTLRILKKDLYDSLLPVSDRDVVVDLGCGDGTMLVGAAQRGARVVGYEINPILGVIAWLRVRRYGGRVQLKNIWQLEALPPKTTVVYYFGASRDIPKLQRCLARWGGGYKLVSLGFEVPGLKEIASHKALHIYEV